MNPRDVLISQGVNPKTVELFMSFHRENPQVWKDFEAFALQASDSRARIGAKAIMERVRWETEVERRGVFKVNNNFTAYYARIFVAKHPEHETLFEFRQVKGLEAA